MCPVPAAAWGVVLGCSLKELVRRVGEARALELTERLCDKVLTVSKKDSNARDVARWGWLQTGFQQQQP